MLPLIRRLVYKMGFRPRPGTILYSPGTAYRLAAEEAWRGFYRTIEEAGPSQFIFIDKSTRRWDDLVNWKDSEQSE